MCIGAPGVCLVMAAGVAIIAAFLRLERAVASRGGMPLIDLALLSDAAFMRGLFAAFFFFFANLSFYLVMTMFMQKALHIPPLRAGLVFVPLALAFVVASRHSGARATASRHAGADRRLRDPDRGPCGTGADGCVGRCARRTSLALVLMIFGYGQGLVMAPLSSAVLSTVKPASAGSGSGMYGTTAQIANAAGRRRDRRGIFCN